MISPLVRILYYIFLKRQENYINDQEAAEVALDIVSREIENGGFKEIQNFKEEMAKYVVDELIKLSQDGYGN